MLSQCKSGAVKVKSIKPQQNQLSPHSVNNIAINKSAFEVILEVSSFIPVSCEKFRNNFLLTF